MQIAPARRAQRRHRGMSAAERADQIGGQDRRPELLGQRVEVGKRDRRRRRRGAGVVDEKIEPAERVDRALDHSLGLARPRHVAGCRDDMPALRAQALDRRRPARVVGQMIERDRSTAAREHLGRRETDPRGGSGHQHRLAGEIRSDHVGPLWENGAVPKHAPAAAGVKPAPLQAPCSGKERERTGIIRPYPLP